jgi:hypothetical protein
MRALLMLAIVATLFVVTAGTARANNPPTVEYWDTSNDCLRIGWSDHPHWYHTIYHVIVSKVGDPNWTQHELDNLEFTWCGAEPQSEYILKVQSCEAGMWPWSGSDCSAWVENPEHYYTKYNLIGDGGFEGWTSPALYGPWATEGTGGKGVDLNLGYAHLGQNNAWIRASSGWNAFTRGVITRPNGYHVLTGWIRTSDNVHDAYFGVRDIDSHQVLHEVKLGPSVGGYRRFTVGFVAPNKFAVQFFVGFWAPNADSWIQVDDLWMTVMD